MRFSVVIPVYNGATLIEGCLLSIKEQLVPVDEIVIVDDGSEDDTKKIANKWKDELPIKLICNEKNMGINYSLRLGVEAAEGEWVLRLDHDDRWLKNHTSIIETLISEPGVALASSSALLVNGDKILKSNYLINGSKIKHKLMHDNPLIHSATCFNKTVYNLVGGYRENVKWEDYDLWISLCAVGEFAYSNVPSVIYKISSSSLSRISRSNARKARWICQKRAISTFFREHPFNASYAFISGFIKSKL